MRLFLCFLLTLAALLPAHADLKPINKKGQRVEIAGKLVADKKNYVIFNADSIYLSRQLLGSVIRWAPAHTDLQFLVVDVNQLDSPVAKQYKLKNLPYVQIYDAKGVLELEGAPAYQKLNEMLKT